MPRAVVKIYYYYHIMFGQEKTGWKGEAGKQENMKKVKSSWLEYFREQVRQFAEMGRNYCPFFRKEAKKLLSELKFYHYNISGNHISWTDGIFYGRYYWKCYSMKIKGRNSEQGYS